MGPDDGASAESRYVCGLLQLRSAFLLFWALDLIFLFNCLVLLLNWVVSGPDQFTENETPLAVLVGFGALTPLIAIGTLSALSALLSFVSVKTRKAQWIVPYLLCSAPLLAILIWLFICALTKLNGNLSWILAFWLFSTGFLSLEQLYFTYIKFRWFWRLVRKRRAISTIERTEIPPNGKVERPPPPTPEDQFDDTYSNKSTVVITDDFYVERS